MSNRIDIDRLLVEMRSLRAQTQAFQQPGSFAARDVANADQLGPKLRIDKPETGFGELFNRAINQVNDTQKASAELAQAYEQGRPDVDITDVMIASEKASVSFQAMVQVRNKLIEAYRDVLNMPI